MKRLRLTHLLPAVFLALPLTVGRADEPEHRWIREFRRQGPPLTRRVAFVIDVSGSMRGEPISLGKREILTILSLFADDGYFKIYAFDEEVREFRSDWTPLPDREAVTEAAEWLSQFSGSGNTALASGVISALKNEAEELAIVLVTDGEPTGDEAAHRASVSTANKKRDTPVPIHVIGVFELEPRGDEFLSRVATENSGAYVVHQRRRLAMH